MDDGKSCKDIPWECGACQGLLAYVDTDTKSKIRIKYKDLFVWVEQPRLIRIACRACGAINQLTDDAADDAPAA